MVANTVIVVVCLLCIGLSSAIDWRRNFTNPIKGFTFSSSALFMVQSIDTIIAVDLKTGNTFWTWNVTKENKCPSGGACFVQSNIKFDPDSGILFVIVANSNFNTSPRAATFFGFLEGVIMWSVPYSTSNAQGLISTAVNAGNCYIVPLSNIQAEAYDCATGKLLWKTTDIPALDTACFSGQWIAKSVAVDPLTQIVIYHCGPNFATWDNKGQPLWTHLIADHKYLSYELAPKGTMMISYVDTICSVKIIDFSQNWCIENDFAVVGAVDSLGTFVLLNETSYFPNIVTLSAHDSQGKYLWGGPSVTYTGVVEIIQSPVWGPLGNYYWVPGQPGGLYILRETDGMIVNQVDVNMFMDQDSQVVWADENGVVCVMGDDYVQVLST